MEKYSEFMIKFRKKLEDEYNSQFENYRDIVQEDRMISIIDKLSELERSVKLQTSNLKSVMMNNVGNILYQSGMWDDKSVYVKIEIGYAFEPQRKDSFLRHSVIKMIMDLQFWRCNFLVHQGGYFNN